MTGRYRLLPSAHPGARVGDHPAARGRGQSVRGVVSGPTDPPATAAAVGSGTAAAAPAAPAAAARGVSGRRRGGCAFTTVVGVAGRARVAAGVAARAAGMGLRIATVVAVVILRPAQEPLLSVRGVLFLQLVLDRLAAAAGAAPAAVAAAVAAAPAAAASAAVGVVAVAAAVLVAVLVAVAVAVAVAAGGVSAADAVVVVGSVCGGTKCKSAAQLRKQVCRERAGLTLAQLTQGQAAPQHARAVQRGDRAAEEAGRRALGALLQSQHCPASSRCVDRPHLSPWPWPLWCLSCRSRSSPPSCVRGSANIEALINRERLHRTPRLAHAQATRIRKAQLRVLDPT